MTRLLDLLSRVWPHARPRVYEVSSIRVAQIAYQRGWLWSEPK